jgi:alcohol dehydrogenase class IV
MNADHLTANWNYPTTVRFGVGRIAQLPDACRDLGMKRPLLVTDRGLAGLPMVADALTRMREAGLPAGLFSEVRGNPVGGDVDAGVAALREGGHDGVIAFGGGSALDVGKAVALMWKQRRPLWDFEDRADWWTRVDPDGMAPVVAVPTTAGTGSEVGRASVITDSDEHVKKIIFHPKMLPGRVLCDPALTVGLPPHLTAATGIDALSHNLEAYCAPGFHPMADGIAVQGIRLVHESLLRATRDGGDLDARGRMLAASLMGATAFQKGLGAMHSVAHVVGAHLDAHHGLLNAIMMPYVLVHNRQVIDARIADLARAMGLRPDFDAFLGWVLDLRTATGIPHTLTAVGLTEAHVQPFAEQAQLDPSTSSNPKAMTVPAFAELIEAARTGALKA